jgi:hypothetical protein
MAKKDSDDLETFGKKYGQQYIDAIDGLYGDGVFDRFLGRIHKTVSKIVLAAVLGSPEVKNMGKQSSASRSRLKKYGDEMRRKYPKKWDAENKKLNKKFGLPDDA